MMHKEVLPPRIPVHPLSLTMSFWLLSTALGVLIGCGIWEGLERASQLTKTEMAIPASKVPTFPRVKLDLPTRMIDCGTAELSLDLFVCAVEYTAETR